MCANFFEGEQNKTQKRCALAITPDKEEFIIYIAVFDTKYYVKIRKKKILILFKRRLTAKSMGVSKAREIVVDYRLAWTQSFLTKLFQRYSTLNTT